MQSQIIALLVPVGCRRAALLVRRGDGQFALEGIDARVASGCGHIIIVPRIGVRKFLSSDEPTVISFTPQAAGDIGFNCSMGMMTRGSKITVLPNPDSKPVAL